MSTNSTLDNQIDTKMEENAPIKFTREQNIIRLKTILNIIGSDDKFYDNISTSKLIATSTSAFTSKKAIHINKKDTFETKLNELKDFYLPKIILTLNNSIKNRYNDSKFYFHKYNFNLDNDKEYQTIVDNITIFLQYLMKNNFLNNKILFKIIDKNDDIFIHNKNITVVFSDILD
jgi:hypothetical protein